MRVLSVLTCVFLVSLMAGCAKPQTVVVPEYRTVDLPERFLAECRITEWRGGTFRDVAKLAAARRVDLEGCNARMREARRLQENRNAEGVCNPLPRAFREVRKIGIQNPSTITNLPGSSYRFTNGVTYVVTEKVIINQ